MKETQKRAILELLEAGKGITRMDAFEMRITNLPAVIKAMRDEGAKIVSIRRERRDQGGELESWWTEYRLG